MTLRAKRVVWRRREKFRYRKWRFYRFRSKRPKHERDELRIKWYRLYKHAHAERVKLDRQIKAATPLRLKALAEAEKLVGIMEVGGNNMGRQVTEIIRANGGTGPEPWCGDFVAWVYRHAGSKVVQRAWAATRFLGFLTGMKRVSEPLPGDLVVYDFSHTGIFVRWINKATGEFEAIEGNTGRLGAVSDSRTGGDGVYKKQDRNRRQVARWVRVLR